MDDNRSQQFDPALDGEESHNPDAAMVPADDEGIALGTPESPETDAADSAEEPEPGEQVSDPVEPDHGESTAETGRAEERADDAGPQEIPESVDGAEPGDDEPVWSPASDDTPEPSEDTEPQASVQDLAEQDVSDQDQPVSELPVSEPEDEELPPGEPPVEDAAVQDSPFEPSPAGQSPEDAATELLPTEDVDPAQTRVIVNEDALPAATAVLPVDEASTPADLDELTPPAGAIPNEVEEDWSDETEPLAEPIGPDGELTQAQLLAQERAERKAARDRALGAVQPAPEPEPAPAPTVRTTDRFFGAFGLFLLRLVLAGIFGIRGVQHFLERQTTTDVIAGTYIPEPSIMALVLAAAEVLIAIALVFGLATRFAGAGIAIIAVSALVFVFWGYTSPFVAGQFGFVGEYELLLATVGLLLVFLGAGRWSIDANLRLNRQRRKETGD